MSNRITTLCRPLVLTPPQKAVLMCLADRANDDGQAWPSLPGICEWTCLRRTAVIQAVKAIEAAGLITVSREAGKRNRVSFDVHRVEALNQSVTRTGSPRAPVRHTNPTSTPDGRDQYATRTRSISASGMHH